MARSQVRSNRVPEKFLEKVPRSLGAGPSQVQRVSEKVPEKVWDLVQSQVRFNRVPEKVPEKVQLRCFQRLASQHASERFCKNKTSRLLGIPPKLFFGTYTVFFWDIPR